MLLPVYYRELCPFQFHKGAIETVNAVVDLPLSVDFQFHKGAIETPPIEYIINSNALSIP